MEKMRRIIKGRFSESTLGIVATVMWTIAGFVASFGKLMNFPSAMNVAVGVASGGNILSVFIGSMCGYAVMGDFSGGIVQLCSILVIAGIRYILPVDRLTLFGHKNEPVFLALITAGVVMLFGCVMSLAVPSDAFTASLRMINGLMCGCVVFVIQTVKGSKLKSGVLDMNGLNGVFLSILYIMIISTLSSLPLGILNAGRAVGTFAMLMAVRKYHHAGGAVAGALTTCGVLLCTPMLARNTLLLATSGLICGVFLQFGSLITLLVFLFTSLVSLVAMGVNSDTFPMFADMLAGAMLFIAIPLPVVKKFTKKVVGVRSPVDVVGQTTSSKLSFASRTIGDIRSQMCAVTAAIDRRNRQNKLSDTVCRAVCEDCPEKAVCFMKKEQLLWSFGKLESVAGHFNCISEEDVKKQLPMCAYPDFLSDVFNQLYSDSVARKANDIRLREMRELLTEQLSSMEDILTDLSFRVGQVRNIDSSLSSQVKDYFDSLGYPNTKACVYVDENLCQRVEVFLTADFQGDMIKLTTGLSAIIEYDLDMPVVVKAERLTRLSFSEMPVFSVQTAVFTASKSGEYSGDSYEIFEQGGCEKYIVLSDGMGTGKRARLDSAVSVNLCTRIIRSGMSMTTSHKMINSMLRVKGWEESFATLDILRCDLFGGTVQLLKSGAAPTYLCRDGSVREIDCTAFPAGILSECEPEVTDMKIFDGDMLLMASDGVESEVARKIGEADISRYSLDDVCSQIGNMALKARNENLRDDITIILVRFSKKSK